jgi:hypothetical protein
LQFALDNGDEFGIFGGMTAEQRGALVWNTNHNLQPLSNLGLG